MTLNQVFDGQGCEILERFDTVSDCEGWVGKRIIDGAIIICIAGTDSAKDMRTNLDCWPKWFGGHSFLFHRGYQKVSLEVCKVIEKYCIEAKKIIFYGHSMGGAVATLAAYWESSDETGHPEVFTFGMPRIGNKKAIQYLNEDIYLTSYRNGFDPVPCMVPVPWLRKHVTKQVGSRKLSRLFKGIEDHQLWAYSDAIGDIF